MLQVKNSNRWLAIGLTALAVSIFAFTGCEPDPMVNPDDTPDPNWALTVENDMTSSMTAVVKVFFASQPGTLAAFIGNDCCGIAEYKAEYGLYWLYISPTKAMTNDQSQTTNVVLRFYSPDLKRIFVAKDTFQYTNNGCLGSPSAPYPPEWTVDK